MPPAPPFEAFSVMSILMPIIMLVFFCVFIFAIVSAAIRIATSGRSGSDPSYGLNQRPEMNPPSLDPLEAQRFQNQLFGEQERHRMAMDAISAQYVPPTVTPEAISHHEASAEHVHHHHHEASGTPFPGGSSFPPNAMTPSIPSAEMSPQSGGFGDAGGGHHHGG